MHILAGQNNQPEMCWVMKPWIYWLKQAARNFVGRVTLAVMAGMTSYLVIYMTFSQNHGYAMTKDGQGSICTVAPIVRYTSTTAAIIVYYMKYHPINHKKAVVQTESTVRDFNKHIYNGRHGLYTAFLVKVVDTKLMYAPASHSLI